MSIMELDRDPVFRAIGGILVVSFFLFGVILFVRAGISIIRDGVYSHPSGRTLTGWQAKSVGYLFLFFAMFTLAGLAATVYGLMFR